MLEHVGLGPVLIVDYLDPYASCKGRILYAALDSGEDDFLVISHVGRDPHFRARVREARNCVRQTRRI